MLRFEFGAWALAGILLAFPLFGIKSGSEATDVRIVWAGGAFLAIAGALRLAQWIRQERW